jgi:3-deoxy-7-phosphoheptulonate synthase
VSWGAIGARTTESQLHRELASGLSLPVGFKNGTGGSVQLAIDAIRAASHPHRFLSVTKQGIAAIVHTSGNEACHIILRGGTAGPNFSPEHVSDTATRLSTAGLPTRIMIDCSHANSGKDHRQQPAVIGAVADQIAGGDSRLFGVMIESHLVEGRQTFETAETAVFGQSITDACIGWDDTALALHTLADATRQRRQKRAA